MASVPYLLNGGNYHVPTMAHIVWNRRVVLFGGACMSVRLVWLEGIFMDAAKQGTRKSYPAQYCL